MESNTLIQRHFTVSYCQVSDALWLAQAELQDEQHHIITKLEVQVPALKIQDAHIEFKRKPLEQCLEIGQKAKELIGVLVMHDLSRKLNELFSGPEGCPNVRHLFGVSGPAFIYTYYPKLMREGKITQTDWWKIAGSELRDDCIAHKRMYETYAGR